MRRHLLIPAALLVGALFSGTSAFAGCPCQGGGVSGPMTGPAGSSYGNAGAFVGPMMQPGPVVPNWGAYPAPPGTLGQTYALRSRPVPTDKHPRAGMIDIRATGVTRILVHDTNEFRTEDKLEGFRDAQDGDLYHFTSEPLYPGLPHIYRVEVHRDGNVQEYYVRLIMGRVVQLNI